MSEDRPVRTLTDVETVSEAEADVLARAGYRTVLALERATPAEIAAEVEGMSAAEIGYLKSGIGAFDADAFLYRPHFPPEEEPPDSVPMFDPQADDGAHWRSPGADETADEPPGEVRAGNRGNGAETGSEATADETAPDTDAGNEAATTGSAVDWPGEGVAAGPDPLSRLPSRVGATVAVLATVVTSALLAVSVGLAGSYAVTLCTAGLFVVTFWALTRDASRYVVAGNFLLIVSSLALLGSLGLAVRIGEQRLAAPNAIVLSAALIFGVVAVAVDLSVGLGAAVRERVRASLVTVSLALPAGVLATAAIGDTLLTRIAGDAANAFGMFLTAPASGLAPFGLLVIEAGTLVVGQYVLRAQVPATAVPAWLRPAFERSGTGIPGALGRKRLRLFAFVWYPVGLGALVLGAVVRQPTGVTGYGPTVFEVTQSLLSFAWTVGRVPLLHWLCLAGIAALSSLLVARVLRDRVALHGQRRSLLLGTLGYVLLVAAVGLVLPAVTGDLEPILADLARRQPAIEPLYVLYQLFGPAPLLLGGSYLGVVTIALLLYGVYLLEVFRVVPADTSGLALGSAYLSVAAVVVGLAGARPAVVFVGIAGVLYVWDVGSYATELGSRLGTGTRTKRAELVHAVGSFAATGLAAGLTYGGYRLTRTYEVVGSEPQLVFGLVLSLAGVIALLVSLRS
jgi:hypothetical protein